MLLVMISLGLERRKPKKNVGCNSVRENILVLNEPYLRLNVNSISLKGNSIKYHMISRICGI